jgi:hypothetical protein
MSLIEQAVLKSSRFESNKGFLTVEDLLHLPLNSTRTSSLESVAQHYHQEVQKAGTTSFTESNKEDNEAQFKLNVIKQVIHIKQTDNAAAKLVSDNKSKKTRILQLIAEKQDTALAGKSEKELLALANSL